MTRAEDGPEPGPDKNARGTVRTGEVLKSHILTSKLLSKGSQFDRNSNMSCLRHFPL